MAEPKRCEKHPWNPPCAAGCFECRAARALRSSPERRRAIKRLAEEAELDEAAQDEVGVRQKATYAFTRHR